MKAQIRYDAYEVDEAHDVGILGGDDSNPKWEEYLEGFKEPFRPHVQAIRKAIEEAGLVGSRGCQVANDISFLVDGYKFTFSWRAWGDLMQAIVGKREGYMAYYM